MSTEPAHFTLTEGGAFMPSPFAQSHWGDDHLNAQRGMRCGAGRPHRDTGHAGAIPALVGTARPSLDGTDLTCAAPPPDDSLLPYVGSDEVGWTRSPAAHQNDSRKRFYSDGIKVLAGEKNSPFVRAVMIAEATSLVTNLGTQGIGYINGDLTAALSRLPVDDWICIQGDSHWASDGISVGTATLFDQQGAFGSGLVTAIANPAAQIDFSSESIPLTGLNYE